MQKLKIIVQRDDLDWIWNETEFHARESNEKEAENVIQIPQIRKIKPIARTFKNLEIEYEEGQPHSTLQELQSNLLTSRPLMIQNLHENQFLTLQEALL